MLYVILGMGVLFLVLGFILTENNAKYLLAGYNTMSESERAKVDIRSYVAYFRRFHIFLGLSFLVFGIAIYYLVNEDVAGLFLAVYPCLAYIYLIIKGKYFTTTQSKGPSMAAVVVLVLAILFTVALFGYGYKENTLELHSDRIELKGCYGEILLLSDIESIELVDQLPRITFKTNGFALRKVKKGYFKTETGEKVKLILNDDSKPYILFITSKGKKIYYASKSESNEVLFEKLKAVIPES